MTRETNQTIFVQSDESKKAYVVRTQLVRMDIKLMIHSEAWEQIVTSGRSK